APRPDAPCRRSRPTCDAGLLCSAGTAPHLVELQLVELHTLTASSPTRLPRMRLAIDAGHGDDAGAAPRATHPDTDPRTGAQRPRAARPADAQPRRRRGGTRPGPTTHAPHCAADQAHIARPG